MKSNKLKQAKHKAERSTLLSALTATETQRAAAKKLGCSATTLHSILRRHPGLVDEAKAARLAILGEKAGVA